MKEIDSLTTLIEKAEWASFVYKEAASAYKASYQKFTEAAVHPRSRAWRSDALIISLLKHCDIQGLTLQSIQNVSQIVSQDLDKAIHAAQVHMQENRKTEEEWEGILHAEFQKVQKLVQKRGKALTGSCDLWKADFDLKQAIMAYVRKETEMQESKNRIQQANVLAYNALLRSYYRTLNEYMASASGHLSILANDVADHMNTLNSPEVVQPEMCLDTPQSVSSEMLLNSPISETSQQERNRFSEVYSQALQESRGKEVLEPAEKLAIRGCGVFIVPKISTVHLVFIVCTNTDYLHAFSIQSILSKISTDLFIEELGCPFKSLQSALEKGSATQIEEINSHLLKNISSLPVIEKVFPILLKNKNIKLQSGGRDIEISDSSSMFFSRRIKIQASSVQMMRKFYSLMKQETSEVCHTSDETGVPNEFMVSWSPATYENP
ncbi:hypothetical protein NEMIN01_1351 [Nematocida minor]|uniref:uncharacterized protein n=1 Tax=Nematocida minor TaxID=1912983 RepID=UPI00221EE2CF|nr:uncharacterized protein NEMIN01_1351 [Nematocida minor]KAI5191082.1 hypothetical protein NEMIN01_1351 [Nematocida minor]